ncbi:MAG: DeoR/GlpR transcriptional regulator [Planctomycetes bacterium]|nr:DeoR/GlpR transcriptional regulator [Planctomycetota bacterium]
MRQFSIHKAFCSCKGIDLERGFSEASTSHASIKGLLMQLADRAYLLADHSKFGVRSMTYSGDLQAVDVVITDDATDASFLNALGKAGVETEVVPRGNRPYGQETQPNTKLL